MDFRPIVIDYMVKNGLEFAQDVDWKALTKLPKFRGLNIAFYYVSTIILIFSFLGTTTDYLQRVHNIAAKKASEKYNLTWDQVTAEVLQKYLREREPRSRGKNIIAREEQIVKFYEELKRQK